MLENTQDSLTLQRVVLQQNTIAYIYTVKRWPAVTVYHLAELSICHRSLQPMFPLVLPQTILSILQRLLSEPHVLRIIIHHELPQVLSPPMKLFMALYGLNFVLSFPALKSDWWQLGNQSVVFPGTE